MSEGIWVGGFVFTVWCLVLSWTSARWWGLPYIAAMLLGFGTCLAAVAWPHWLRDVWCDLGCIYAVVLPIARTVRRRYIEQGGEW